jgi:N-acetylmuramic acid 6-phosphate etherase
MAQLKGPMLDHLTTEQRNPASLHIDSLPTERMLALINEADQAVPAAVAAEIPHIAQAVDMIATRIRGGGRLFYLGAGTSGRLGVLDASECPPTFSVPKDLVVGIIAGGDRALREASEASEDDPEAGARDLTAAGFSARDTLVGIAASGRTPYVLGAVRYARSLGALTIGISCTANSELSKAVDLAIEPKPGPEVLTGSTRMRAGTATKLILNMISTGVMIRLGYVYSNLMVNVQPTNQKLAERARRIIREATGATPEEAAALLDAAQGSVRHAIVMGKRKVTRAEADRLLEQAGGRVAEALGETAALHREVAR